MLVGRSVGLGFAAVLYAARMAPTGGDYRHCKRWLSSWVVFALSFAFAVSSAFFVGWLGFFAVRDGRRVALCLLFGTRCFGLFASIDLVIFFAHASSVLMFSPFLCFFVLDLCPRCFLLFLAGTFYGDSGLVILFHLPGTRYMNFQI